MAHSTFFAARLMLGTMLLCSLTGCTAFQTMCTNQWLEAKWLDAGSEQPVSQLMVVWDNRIRSTQNSENNGASLPGVAGRLYLFSDESTQLHEARGTVFVQMNDMTSPAPPGQPPSKLGEWTFPAQSLKQLKRKDMVGEGYTLFLPWDTYHPSVKKVQLIVCYAPEKGSPHYAEPAQVTLQGEDQPLPTVRREQFVPAQRSQLTPISAGPRTLQPPYLSGMPQQPMPTAQQPPPQNLPGTQVKYLPVAPNQPQGQNVPR